jgi:hypothetical protein
MTRCAGVWIIIAAAVITGGWSDAAELPTMDPSACELHGVMFGQPFWAKLLVSDAQFGNNRVLQLVYTPPAFEKMDGAHLSDCPFVLVDEHLRIVAWNGRDSASSAEQSLKPPGYRISRDLLVGEGDAKHSEGVKRALPGELGWDLHLAPVLLALGWKEGASCQVRVIDLFGTRWQDQMTIGWTGHEVTAAGQAWVVTPDEHGQLKRLTSTEGAVLLEVSGRP